ncbi:MAG TPA: head GIN domain-containing protein [Draconibacterium sp.]|nr:head GIN domain-containing protein [Draconibacterium sp.]
MKTKFTLLVSLSLVLLSSCIIGPWKSGNGHVAEQTRKVSSFDEIKVSRGMNVYISQGNEIKVVVEADENLLDIISTEVDNHTLKVTTTENIRRATSKKVYVTIPEISGITAVAGSNAFSENVLHSKMLEISGSAGSNIKLEVDAGKIDASASAGSNIKLEGKASSFTGKASSGANIKAEELTVAECNARVSSGANLWITVSENLDAHASSGGNIIYYGQPKTTNIESSSGGNIVKR